MAGPDGSVGADLERQACGVDADRRRLERRVRTGQPALSSDVDRLELLIAAVADRVPARLRANVARVAVADAHPARVPGVLTLHPAKTQGAREALQLAGAHARAPATTEPAGSATECVAVFHAAIVAKTRRLDRPKSQIGLAGVLASLRNLLYIP